LTPIDMPAILCLNGKLLMNKNIQILGRVKLPFDDIISVINHRATKTDASFDTERSSYHRNRTKLQLQQSKNIIGAYRSKKQATYFYRYTNPKLLGLIPATFWKKYKMIKDSCRAQILRHPPGTVSIPHIDRYDSMMKEMDLKDSKKIKRLWISLTEPKLGHALFVGNDVAYNLKQGTVLTFNKDTLHSGCNAGHEDRYVLTLTGIDQ